MHHIYTATQWVLLFFFYSLCGWVWESCYVSLRQRRWVNRGFLHGPLLPIYGFGAVIILLATIPVERSLVLIYVCGTLAATLLEYVTGAVMERMFHVRYWDYSNQKCNLSGYICLSSSIAWGFFSILLVRFVHPPIAALLLRMPNWLTDPLALGLVASTAVDAAQSFNAAMDLKNMLARLTEENEELRRLARRAEVITTFAEADLREFREHTEVERLLAQQERAQRREDHLRRRQAAKLQALDNIAAALEDTRLRMEQRKELAGDALEQRRKDIAEMLEKIRSRQASIRSRSPRAYDRSLRILRGNPTARTREFGEALESLRKLGELKKK